MSARGGDRTRTFRRRGGFKTSHFRPAGVVVSVWPAHVRCPFPSRPSGSARSVSCRRVLCRNRAGRREPIVLPSVLPYGHGTTTETIDLTSLRPRRRHRPSRHGRGHHRQRLARRPPPPTASASTPDAAGSPNGNAPTEPSLPTSSPMDSPGPGRCCAASRHARAPE